MPIKSNFVLFSDPGHGWLRVPVTEITRLGLTDNISNYSYQHGPYVYLEEDCDLATFVSARQKLNQPITIVERSSNGYSRIRRYAQYHGTVKMVTRTNLMTGNTYQEASNTPNCCSPSTEQYWSM
jgi:hypothetical protein